MSLFSEIRSRARHIAGPVLSICAAGYFAYHAIHGKRGFIALRQLSHHLEIARVEHSKIKYQRMLLEHRVSLLHPDSIDPDMLDERARLMMNLGLKDDLIIVSDAEENSDNFR